MANLTDPGSSTLSHNLSLAYEDYEAWCAETRHDHMNQEERVKEAFVYAYLLIIDQQNEDRTDG